jgi:hypothetical protein
MKHDDIDEVRAMALDSWAITITKLINNWKLEYFDTLTEPEKIIMQDIFDIEFRNCIVRIFESMVYQWVKTIGYKRVTITGSDGKKHSTYRHIEVSYSGITDIEMMSIETEIRKFRRRVKSNQIRYDLQTGGDNVESN